VHFGIHGDTLYETCASEEHYIAILHGFQRLGYAEPGAVLAPNSFIDAKDFKNKMKQAVRPITPFYFSFFHF
jgi:hypothetical protein